MRLSEQPPPSVGVSRRPLPSKGILISKIPSTGPPHTVNRPTTIGGGIHPDGNNNNNDDDHTTDSSTPLGGEINPGGGTFDNSNNNNDTATTTISLTKVDSDKLESIIQRAVERSFAEAVDKAFTSTLTNPSSKGYSLVTKVFDNLLDIQKKREESSDQEYRRYAADPNLYLRQMDDDSVNASVTTPTVR